MKTRTQEKVKDKRQDVLDAALKLTAEKGFAATSTANIAEEANVGMGTIYRYFKSKDILFSALFNELRNKFVQLLVSNYNFEMDTYSNFRNIVYVVVRYYINHPYEFKYLERYSDAGLNIDQKFNEKTLQLEPIKKMLSNKANSIKFKDMPFFVLFALMYGPLVAVVNLVHMNKVTLTDELIAQIADSCWESVTEK